MTRDETGSASALLTEMGHCQFASYAFDEAKASFERARVLRERMGRAIAAIASTVDLAQVAIETDAPDSARGALQSALADLRSEEHTSELQSLMRISDTVFCLKTTPKTHCT